MEQENKYGYGTYEDVSKMERVYENEPVEDVGNGYTASGAVAGDYLAAGRDPKLPRLTADQIAAKVKALLGDSLP